MGSFSSLSLTKLKKKLNELNEHFTDKMNTDIDLHWNLSSSLRCTDCNTKHAPPTHTPSPNRPLATPSSRRSESGARAGLFGMRVARGCSESEAGREESATFCSVLNAAATSPTQRTASANQSYQAQLTTCSTSTTGKDRVKTELSLNNP